MPPLIHLYPAAEVPENRTEAATRSTATGLVRKYIPQLLHKIMPEKQIILTTVTDQIKGSSVADLVLGLGLAVAKANKELGEGTSGVVYTIPEADIELKVALSMTKTATTSIGGSIALQAFNVNASYASTFGYSAEASSVIKIKLRADAREAPAPPPVAAAGGAVQ